MKWFFSKDRILILARPQIDTAVRAALVAKLDPTSGSSNDLQAPGFSPIAPLADPSLYPSLASEPNEAPIATSTLRPSALDKIQDFLVRGERRKAYHYALDEKLWAHAMLIASSIDRDAWKETVNEFLRTELGAKTTVSGTEASQSPTNGREGLRVAYSLYSGQGSASGTSKRSRSPTGPLLIGSISARTSPTELALSCSGTPPTPATCLPHDSHDPELRGASFGQ